MEPLELEPTIAIRCVRVPVSGGQFGQHRLEPQISLTNMPGNTEAEAWTNTHMLLLQCLQIAQQQITKALTGDTAQRVQVVPMLPGDLVRH